jgi:hypothetical protein
VGEKVLKSRGDDSVIGMFLAGEVLLVSKTSDLALSSIFYLVIL